MPSSRRSAFLAVTAIAALVVGGVVAAQLESGDRGILPVDSSGTLEITGIHVDVGGKDANAARYAGWRVAQREGFKALWAKQHKRPLSEAPTLSDSTLDGLVSSIIVEREQIGPTQDRYRLGGRRHWLLFDNGIFIGKPGHDGIIVGISTLGNGAQHQGNTALGQNQRHHFGLKRLKLKDRHAPFRDKNALIFRTLAKILVHGEIGRAHV